MSNKWCVYEHRFPNGKRYIGITSNDPEKRWNNGNGYKQQTKVRKAIKHYGWDNIKHTVLVDGLSREAAERLEQYLIAELDTIGNGYNVAIGGNAGGKATYLSPYLMMMIWGAKNYHDEDSPDIQESCVGACDRAKHDKHEAEYWNEAARAVVGKWREYSPTNYDDNHLFWWHMEEYERLYQWQQRGYDTTEWFEVFPTWERFNKDMNDRLRDMRASGLIKVFCEYTDEIDPETLRVVFNAHRLA